MNLPTDLLRTFVTIADLGGVTRAGEVLGRSQPAVSLQVKRLEELVDKPLLTRSGRRMQPTEDGARLLEYARQILRLNDEAVAALVHPRLAGHVRLGIPNEFAMSVLPDILGHFAQSHPGVTLEVNCALSKHLLEGLERREFDIVIAIHDTPDPEGLEVWNEELSWVSAPGHDSFSEGPVPLIVAPSGCVYRKRIIDTLTREGVPWRIVYTSTSYGGIRAAALAGLGVTALARSTMPEGLRTLAPDARYPLLEPAQVAIHCDRRNVSDVGQLLVDHISDRIRSDGSTAVGLSSRTGAL